MRNRRMRNQRGAALLETAITLPILLLVCVAIFEFGRAYQTWQVLTNAAREGARVAIIVGNTDTMVTDAVVTYANIGGITVAPGEISINRSSPLGSWSGSTVTVAHPFSFIVLNPIAKLIASGSKTGEPLTMTAVATMRNEVGS